MTLSEMVYHRKSCRSFTGRLVDAEMIKKILSFELKPLYPEIKVRMDIVSRNKVKCICPWTTPQLIAVYSEEAEGYLENIGFLFQQMDLYVANEERFRFFKAEHITDLPGYGYIGSATL